MPKRTLTQPHLKWTLVMLLGCMAAVGQAKPPFFELYKSYYKVDASSPVGQAGCKNCHSEGTRRNAYGKELSKLVKMSDNGMLTVEMLQKVENLDSDGDGWANGDEIKAGFLPGDPAVHPEGKPGDPIKPKATDKKAGGGSLIPTHAFHPSFVHFPIALFIFGMILELVGVRKKSSEYAKAAYWNLIGALVSLAIVVPTGVAAWLMNGLKIEGTLLIHMLLAASSLTLMIISLSLRKRLGPTNSIYLTILVINAIVIALTGHFGGNLVFG